VYVWYEVGEFTVVVMMMMAARDGSGSERRKNGYEMAWSFVTRAVPGQPYCTRSVLLPSVGDEIGPVEVEISPFLLPPSADTRGMVACYYVYVHTRLVPAAAGCMVHEACRMWRVSVQVVW